MLENILEYLLSFYFYDFENSDLKKNYNQLFVILSFLSSVWAIALVPAYFARFYFIKSKETLILFISAAFSSFVQFFIIFNSYFINTVNTGRFQIEISKIFYFIYNVPVRSFFGSTIPEFLFLKSSLFYLKFFDSVIYILFLLLIVILIVYVFKKKDFILSLISFTFILVSVFAIIGSLYDNHIGVHCFIRYYTYFFVLRVYLSEEEV